MSNILEAYTHEIEHPAFSNFKTGTPARFQLNPDVEEEHEHLANLHKMPRNPAHTEALQDHTSSSQSLNLSLVNNSGGEYTRSKANRVSHAITDNIEPLDSEHHIYSGLGPFNPHAILEHSGGVFKAKHFVSATIDPVIAMRHDNHKRQILMDGRTDTHIIHFHLPKGYASGRYIAKLSEFQGEHEMLLDKDQHWKVDNVHTIHGYHPVTNTPMSRTIWSVKPHTPEATVKEEVEHRLHDYFDDHTNPSHANRTTYHPHLAEFEDHEAYLRSLTHGKTALLPKQDLEHGIQKGQMVHKGIAAYSRDSAPVNEMLMGKVIDYHVSLGHWSRTGHSLDETAKQISSGIKGLNHPLDHTLHVYSGTGHPGLVKGQVKVGDVLHTPSFTSTSIKHNVAKWFGWDHTHPNDPNTEHHVIHFELPTGYDKGAYIQPHSWLPHEHEYLLDKDQKWKVKEHNIVKTRDPGSTNSTAVDRHVWTVVPHEENIVQEALVHAPTLFRERQLITTNASKHTYQRTAKYSSAAGNDRHIRNMLGDVHHTRLLQTHKFTPNDNESSALDRYSRGGSEEVSNHLFMTPDEHKEVLRGVVQKYNQYYKEPLDPKAEHIDDVPKNYNHHEHMQSFIKSIADTINKHSVALDHEAHVYSGIGFDPSKHFEEGKGVIHMPAFTSTSLNAETPMTFGKLFNAGNTTRTKQIKPFTNVYLPQDMVKSSEHVMETYTHDKHIIHFKLPVGYKKGLYIAPHSHYAEEHEYLLDKGQKWKLEKHEVVNSWRVYRGQSVEHYNNGEVSKHTAKDKLRRHIWTVVPHDSQPDAKSTVAESMVHVPKLLGNKTLFADTASSGTHYTLQKIQNQASRKFGNVHEEHLLQTHSFTPSVENRAILADFTHFGARRVNSHLLQKPPGPHEGDPLYSGHVTDKFAHHVTNLINTYAVPLDHEAHVYSGVGFDPTKHFEESKGVLHMPAFTSTSLNYETPRSFSDHFNQVHDHKQETFTTPNSKKYVTKISNNTVRDSHIIHFKLPVGYKKGLYIAPHSRYGEEHEYLLDKGQKWKLEKHEHVNGWYSSRSVEQADQNLSHSGNAPEIHYNDKIKTKTHIWTVVPHTEQDVHEALVHVPDLLKDGDINVHHSWHTSDIHKNMLNRVDDKLQQRRQLAQDIGDVHDKHLRAFNPYNLSIDEREAVVKYTGSWSSTINKKLIDPTKDVSHYEPDVTRYTNQLHHVIKKYAKPLDKESHFYSGIGFDPTKHFEEGNNVIHMPAFISSSASTDTAKDFGKPKVPAPRVTDKSISPKNSYREPGQHTTKITQKQTIVDRHVLHFKCPVGFKDGLYVAPHSRITEEHEFLMNKGLKWKLEKHEVVHGTTSSRFEGAELDPNSHDLFKTLPVKISSKTKTARHIWTVVPHPDTP